MCSGIPDSGVPDPDRSLTSSSRLSTVHITEVRIKLVTDVDDRLRAFCSITFDGEFVVRDLKIIQGQRGHFVAMPSRKLMEKCTRCSAKNDIKARYCSHCGTSLPVSSHPEPSTGRTRMFADIAHPINPICRERIESAVLASFEEEKIRATQPGYVCRYDDFDEPLPRIFDASAHHAEKIDSHPAAG